ncbi:MAG: hypothetical protein REI95_14680, partial [Oxalicibacterium faecigallinarum]|uniref:hypothetical protein n=1 Tax=Oxalicibacterium faecigallinarum TaxID=573741 RepID=UPI00280798D7
PSVSTNRNEARAVTYPEKLGIILWISRARLRQAHDFLQLFSCAHHCSEARPLMTDFPTLSRQLVRYAADTQLDTMKT